MSPLDLIYLAAASIRAGKAGTSVKAWCDAINEARTGYVIVLENAPGILAQIDASLERMAAKENGTPPETGETPVPREIGASETHQTLQTAEKGAI